METIQQFNDGGAAFPHDFQQGLSIRDYFAAKAMNAMLQEWFMEHNEGGTNTSSHKGIAEDAYKMADAMIVERQKFMDAKEASFPNDDLPY